MTTKKLATIAAALLISVTQAAIINNLFTQLSSYAIKSKLLSRNPLTAQFKSSTAKAIPLPLPKVNGRRWLLLQQLNQAQVLNIMASLSWSKVK